MTAPFPGYLGPGRHDGISLRAAHCRDCAGWCRRDDPCQCCLAVMTDQRLADLLPGVDELARVIYGAVARPEFDPRPLAVRLWREGWRKR